MVQSPSTLFCYWKLSNERKQIIKHHFSEEWFTLHKKIRIYDITKINFNGHNAHRYQDISLAEACTQTFIYDVAPNRTYCVDYGVETQEGNFFSIVRSNEIVTPRASSFKVGFATNTISKWQEGNQNDPEWFQGYSCYSYYEKNKGGEYYG